MSQDFYEEIAPIYDRMIRWERRLKLEEPLFQGIWNSCQARSVLDASCGSGRHLVLFARQGLEVTGADASAAMLRLAREQIASLPAPQQPRLVQSVWADLPHPFHPPVRRRPLPGQLPALCDRVRGPLCLAPGGCGRAWRRGAC